MLIGDPERFALLIERVPAWETANYRNGLLYLMMNGRLYPQELHTTTLNSDLYALTAPHAVFAEPPYITGCMTADAETLLTALHDDPEWNSRIELYELQNAGYYLYCAAEDDDIRLLLGKWVAPDVIALAEDAAVSRAELSAMRTALMTYYAEELK